MEFFNRLEKKYRKYAIQNLMLYVVIMYGIGFLLDLFAPAFYYQYLSMNVQLILRGQVWRLVTFLVTAPTGGGLFGVASFVFYNLIALYFYYRMGQMLEYVWGAFKVNVYFLMGVLGHIAAAFVGYFVFRQIWPVTPTFLNFSLFLAYAYTFPDTAFMLFFLIPIKAKVLAIVELAVYAYLFVIGGVTMRVMIVMSLANTFFFLFLIRGNRLNPSHIRRRVKFRQSARQGVKIRTMNAAHHKCAICGRTEKDGEGLEFRYCSKCAGAYEYCAQHLYTHAHVLPEEPGDHDAGVHDAGVHDAVVHEIGRAHVRTP
ncbi:MAG: hypothetical protein LBR77_08820, partial [Lachnospiraceae bacterium]|nr:hypothetical protein [Lachnospiraceae bacterium]